MMSDSCAWVCICILEGGHFSIPDADCKSKNDWVCSKVQGHVYNRHTTSQRWAPPTRFKVKVPSIRLYLAIFFRLLKPIVSISKPILV